MYTEHFAIDGSWEFAEFCKAQNIPTDTPERRSVAESKFKISHPDKVSSLVKRYDENYVTCGRIGLLTKQADGYAFGFLDPLDGHCCAGGAIPGTFLDKIDYTPKEGDELTHIMNKETGEVSLLLRKDGTDVELYKYSKEECNRALDIMQEKINNNKILNAQKNRNKGGISG